MLQKYGFIIGLLFLSSCSFNRSFYYPDQAPVASFPDAEDHYIPYGENDSIHALFFKQDLPKANLFILHGNAGNLTSWGEMADLFYTSGYQVFILDYPSFGNSTGKLTHENVILSTEKAALYFNELPTAKDNKSILMGYSLGGNLAIKIGTNHPTLFDGMILEAPFDTHRAEAMHVVPALFRFAPFLLTKNTINGKKLIAKWTKPLLLIHSKDDQMCPYEMSQRLIKSAVLSEKKELWTIKGPHLAGLGQNLDLYLAKMNAMVEYLNNSN
jgi:uncharacterized protein